MSRVVVTGGAGVIGRALVNRLQASGNTIVVVDRRSPDPALCEKWDTDQVSFVAMDVRETAKLTEILSSADALVHLAASSSILDFEEQPTLSYRNTVDAATSVARAVRTSRHCHTLIFASTAAVYEGQSLPYSEDQSTSPPDLKASAKSVTEDVARSLHDECGNNVTVLRPFSVYSEYEMDKGTRANVLSLFVWAVAEGDQPVIWGDGEQTRDFVHADDAARAFELALDSAEGYSLFNICSGIETSFRKLLQTIGQISGNTITPSHIGVQLPIYAKRLVGVPTKALRELGFRTNISVAEGASRAWRIANTPRYQDKIVAQAHRRWRRPDGSAPNKPFNSDLRKWVSPARSAG